MAGPLQERDQRPVRGGRFGAERLPRRFPHPGLDLRQVFPAREPAPPAADAEEIEEQQPDRRQQDQDQDPGQRPGGMPVLHDHRYDEGEQQDEEQDIQPKRHGWRLFFVYFV